MFPSTANLTCSFYHSLRVEGGGGFLRYAECACFLSDLLLNSCARNLNLMLSHFSIESLVFIGLDKLLVIFGFVGDGICDSCGKIGCHAKGLLDVYAWFC